MHTNSEQEVDVEYCGLVGVKKENGKTTVIQDGNNLHLN